MFMITVASQLMACIIHATHLIQMLIIVLFAPSIGLQIPQK